MTYISLQDPELARLRKSRSRLGSKAPGYAAIVFGMPIVETHRTDTMATDGTSMFFNRTYVQNTPDDQLMTTVFHEGCHKSLFHHLRRPSSCDARTWNIACDYVVNLLAVKARFKLPEGALLDWQYDGMTAEQIVKLLIKEQQKQPEQPEQPQGEGEGEGEGEGQGSGGAGDDTDDDQDQDQDDGQGGGGDDTDDGEDDAPSGMPDNFDQPGEVWDAVDSDTGERLSGDDLAKEEETLRRDIIVAAMAEKAAGSGSITMDGGVVEAAKAATVDWVEALADFLNRAYAGEPTLAKPARRHLPPFYLVDQEGLEPHAFIYFTDGWASVEERTADVVNYPVLWATTGVEPSFRGQEFGEVVTLTM